MTQKKSKKRVFYAVLPNKNSTVEWCLADAKTAYGLPPRAFLDLGGGEPTVWVLVVCNGRQSSIVWEQVWYEECYDMFPLAMHPRKFCVARQSSSEIGASWEQAREKAIRKEECERYSIWRAAIEKCVSTSGYFMNM